MLACPQALSEGRSQSSTNPPGALSCPRCTSTDTKFCYYNNYRATQPRYFCKSCKRYWTEGGTLRNVPVGGGLRKNKKQQHQTSLDAGMGSKHGKSSPAVGKSQPNDSCLDNGAPVFLPNHSSSFYRGSNSPVSTSDTKHSVNGLPYFQQASMGSQWQRVLENRKLPSLGGYTAMQADMNFGSGNALPSTSLDQGQSSSGEAASERFRAKDNMVNQASVSACQSGQQSSEEEEDWQQYAAAGTYGDLGDGRSVLPLGDADSDGASSNIVSVRYPFDWQEVTECLFGGTGDFVYYVIPGGREALSDFGMGRL